MIKKLYLTLALFLCGFFGLAQQIGEFRNTATGNWQDTTIWEVYTISGWQKTNVNLTTGANLVSNI